MQHHQFTANCPIIYRWNKKDVLTTQECREIVREAMSQRTCFSQHRNCTCTGSIFVCSDLDFLFNVPMRDQPRGKESTWSRRENFFPLLLIHLECPEKTLSVHIDCQGVIFCNCLRLCAVLGRLCWSLLKWTDCLGLCSLMYMLLVVNDLPNCPFPVFFVLFFLFFFTFFKLTSC